MVNVDRISEVLTILYKGLTVEEFELLSKSLYWLCVKKGIEMPEEYATMNMDASQRLAYGLCKREGIDTKGMTPREAWEALKEKTGKGPEEYYAESGNPGANKIRFGTASAKSFSKALETAKSAVDKSNQWRVTGMNRSQVKDWHQNAKLHVTDGGSTIAVDGGDIVAVCANPDDELRGKDLLAFAVKNGGVKLDSYEGNHGFYVKCGFEPVSWCKWDDEYAPPGWKESGQPREDIVFYKYTGNKRKMTKEEAKADCEAFKKNTPPSADYDTAYSLRDMGVK